jgi:hypothetical protein
MKKEEGSHASVKRDLEEHFVTEIKQVSLVYSRSISSSFNSSSISRDPMTVIFHVPLMFYNCFTSPVILHAISIHCFELFSHLCSEQ